ncbi:Adenylate kinase [Flaviramulus basaltis]|uniref:Adenylate kinase n=1 Tax=Flaviramulus basaltis TaxID=369401 RepID=A0A1K2IGH0_9FLAO|nr:AAA family ATPase [Flaviramulus basaltis]SFZ91521.1 Adenylate kinase [Flaviramulus basaltis]
MKILIFGASGSGTTTLGKEVGKMTDFIHLDVDNYYWKQTDPPFQEKISFVERNKNLKTDFEKFKNIIVTGSLVSWGKEWETVFDLAVFIRLNNNKRIKRLKKREIERYGDKLLTDKKIMHDSNAFLEWANQYENPNFDGRSLNIHNNWIELLNCKVLKIDGEMELKNKTDKVIAEIKAININSYN